MAPFLYIEAGTFLEYGFYGWRSVWNFMDVVAYVNQVGNYANPTPPDSVLYSILLDFQPAPDCCTSGQKVQSALLHLQLGVPDVDCQPAILT